MMTFPRLRTMSNHSDVKVSAGRKPRTKYYLKMTGSAPTLTTLSTGKQYDLLPMSVCSMYTAW